MSIASTDKRSHFDTAGRLSKGFLRASGRTVLGRYKSVHLSTAVVFTVCNVVDRFEPAVTTTSFSSAFCQIAAARETVDTSRPVGLRDRALIGVIMYRFTRVGSIVQLKLADYYSNGKRWWLRLQEKGGKFYGVPTHNKAQEYLDAYLNSVDTHPGEPLFRTAIGRSGEMTIKPMTRHDVNRMIKAFDCGGAS